MQHSVHLLPSDPQPSALSSPPAERSMLAHGSFLLLLLLVSARLRWCSVHSSFPFRSGDAFKNCVSGCISCGSSIPRQASIMACRARRVTDMISPRLRTSSTTSKILRLPCYGMKEEEEDSLLPGTQQRKIVSQTSLLMSRGQVLLHFIETHSSLFLRVVLHPLARERKRVRRRL